MTAPIQVVESGWFTPGQRNAKQHYDPGDGLSVCGRWRRTNGIFFHEGRPLTAAEVGEPVCQIEAPGPDRCKICRWYSA
jgi:hypothetical protein